MAHPSKAPEGDFERHSCVQMYFLEPDVAAKKFLVHPLDHVVSRNPMNRNNYGKGCMKIREVEDDLNQPAASLGKQHRIKDK